MNSPPLTRLTAYDREESGARSAAPSPDIVDSRDLRGCRVLFIEDERIIRELVVKQLKGIGIADILEVSSAESAWEYLVGAKARTFDVIITDLTLPGVSGKSFVKNLRALPLPRAKTIPVIILTGDSGLDTFQKLRRHGISAYLMKPVSPNILSSAIRRATAPGAEQISITCARQAH